MSRSRSEGNSKRRREQARAKRQRSEKKGWKGFWHAYAYLSKKVSPLWVVFGACLSIFTAFYAYEYLSPYVSLEQGPELDTQALIKCPFQIKNESVFSIYHIQMHYGDGILTSAMGATVRFNNGGVYDGQEPIDEIEPHQTAARMLPAGIQFAQPLNRADILIFVSYRPSFWFYEKTQIFHFVALKGTDGFLHWYPEVFDKKNPFAGPKY